MDAPVELGKTKVTGLGISLLGNDEQPEGPFCIDMESITARHELDADSINASHDRPDEQDADEPINHPNDTKQAFQQQ